jgi:hypothetical protein
MTQKTNQHSAHKKERMPTGMYIGSAWIGFAILMLLCWMLALMQSNTLLQESLGTLQNYRIILNLIAIFGFAIPMLIGLRILKRAKQQVQEQERKK